jgi:predicted pyridoxine 5'-phosphate oxidase superfamily flavin-nucleotide-binding protein
MRSKIWEEYQTPPIIQTPSDFFQHSRFMFVATSDNQRRADLSPKGDPAGKLLQLDGSAVWYPDRPGNRRVDGFRNILSQPNIEIMALLAGSPQVLRITGKAILYSDHPNKNSFEVEGKVPAVVAKVEPEKISLEHNAALERARLWPPRNPGQQFKAAEIWQAHMKLSKLSGLEATLAKTAISVPGVIDQALKWDYKNNLY